MPALDPLADVLRQELGRQTIRLATAICVSAFVFHTASGTSAAANLLDVWDSILKVNYWPIFSIAGDLGVLVVDATE